MAEVGRPRKPAALRVLEDNRSRTEIPAEAQPNRLAPPCPADMTGDARAEWDRLAPQLVDLGLLRETDLAAFAAYCYAWADFLFWTREIERDRRKAGRSSQLIETKDIEREILKKNGEKEVVIVPVKAQVFEQSAVKRMRSAEEMMRRYLGKFGLSPADRAGLAAGSEARDEWSDYDK